MSPASDIEAHVFAANELRALHCGHRPSLHSSYRRTLSQSHDTSCPDGTSISLGQFESRQKIVFLQRAVVRSLSLIIKSPGVASERTQTLRVLYRLGDYLSGVLSTCVA